MGDSATNIVSRLATRLDNAIGDRHKPDYLTRDIGGHFRNNQPYISGYFQIVCGLPEEIFGGTDRVRESSRWLHSTCESFTPHTQTLNKADIQGQGQIGSSFVTSVTTTREFTLAFREYQNLPILNIIKKWASVMDPFVGVSPLDGNRFIPFNYKGWIMVAQTKPVRAKDEALSLDDLEECYIYNGVFPTTIPLDALNSDITANDTAQLSCTFSFDGAPLTSAEPGISAKAIELLGGMHMLGTSAANDDKSTYHRYWEYDTSGKTTQWGTHNDQIETGVDPDGTEMPSKVSV